MLLSGSPAKIQLPFATDGTKNTIPVPSQIGVTPGAASYTDGFPPQTMEPVSSGGVPPFGADFNGILFAATAPLQWYSAGAGFTFDATFAGEVGGYPKGAKVFRADSKGYWLSTIDNNSNNPDTGGTGWVPDRAVASVFAANAQTLAMGTSKVLFDTVDFDDLSLWDATDKRYVAKYPGKYRLTSSVKLNTPSGQLYTMLLFRNGNLARQCAEFPQVSDGDLTFSMDAIANCGAGDYLEVFIGTVAGSVTAGVNGDSIGVFVFAQIEYLGL